MKVYAKHKTLNGGNYFAVTCEAVQAAVEHWDNWFNVVDNFELWWLSQLIKHKQNVKFWILHYTPQPWLNFYSPIEDEPIYFFRGKNEYKVVEPRGIFFRGSV